MSVKTAPAPSIADRNPHPTPSNGPATPTAIADPLPPEVEDHLKPVIADFDPNGTEGQRYNPDTIAAYYQQRPFEVIGRIFQVLLPFLFYGLTWWWNSKTGNSEAQQQQQAIQLREMLTKLGPAYIKVGQALSTRPDLVPPIFLVELTKLQDQLPPFDNAIAYQFIEEELGSRPEDIYAEISPTPVAAASLGQVYRGRLKTGEEVAIKVQRPGLARRIALDLYLMRGISAWVMKNVKRVRSDLIAITDEFAARIFEEMDYTQEGRNAERFASLYGYMADIYVPKIYWKYTGRRVLTMEWITGTKLTQIEEITAQGIDATYLVEVGVQCSLRQLLENGFFHADPHPGNLLAMPNGKLAYLDFGMMSEMKPYQRYGLIEAIVHLVNRDFEGLAKDYVKLEFLTPDVDLTPIIPAFAMVFKDALGASVAEINIKSITDQLSAVMYEYPFQVPAYFALIIRSLVTLEGIAIGVDPDFKVLSKAYPYVAKRLLTDPAPELRASLKDLLFKDETFRWNRLENLLRNARDNSDYDLETVVDQTLEYLFSERGDLIRGQMVDVAVKGLDTLGNNAIQGIGQAIAARLGIPVPHGTAITENQQTLEQLQRIWGILQETQGFDPMKVLPVLPRLLFKPEVHQMGQQIASGLAQRAIARFIRETFLTEPASAPIATPPSVGSQPRLSPAPSLR